MMTKPSHHHVKGERLSTVHSSRAYPCTSRQTVQPIEWPDEWLWWVSLIAIAVMAEVNISMSCGRLHWPNTANIGHRIFYPRSSTCYVSSTRHGHTMHGLCQVLVLEHTSG
jgi:hypothetical protein